MQERIEGYVPYNNNLYEKIAVFMLSESNSWTFELFIELLMRYGIIHIKYNKARTIHDVIWKCNSCSMQLCVKYREILEKAKIILWHIRLSELSREITVETFIRGSGPAYRINLNTKFIRAWDEKYECVSRTIAINCHNSEDIELSLMYKLTLYLPHLIICMMCGSLLNEGISPTNDVLVKHILDDMDAVRVKCCGDDDKNGEKE